MCLIVNGLGQANSPEELTVTLRDPAFGQSQMATEEAALIIPLPGTWLTSFPQGEILASGAHNQGSDEVEKARKREIAFRLGLVHMNSTELIRAIE